jgi:hypothetical protein
MSPKNGVALANALFTACASKSKVHWCARGTVLSEAHPQKPSSDTRWWMCPAGMSRGQYTHAGTSTFRTRQARKDRGGAARRAPHLACPRGILPPNQCSLAPQLRGDAEAKMCFIFLCVEAEALEAHQAFVRGLLDSSTTDAKALRASAGWRAKERV